MMKKSLRLRNPPNIHVPPLLNVPVNNEDSNNSGMSWTCLKIMVAIGVLIIVQYTISIIIMRGYHQSVYTHHPGRCRNVPPMMTGSEDIALTSDGLAFITSGIKLFHKLVQSDPRIMAYEGNIFLFDFNHPTKPARKLKMSATIEMSNFAPQGITIWEDGEAGDISVLVVNHRLHEARDTVEIFSFDKSTMTLHHQKTVWNELFRSLNDITATGPSSFYITNDGYYRFSPIRLLERFGMFPWGDVLHVDDNTALKVLNRMYEVSGIAASPDGRFVFLTSPYGKALHIYRRQEDDKLRFYQRIDLRIAPDDVTFDPVSGDLIVSCFPVWHLVFKSVSNFQEKGAAQVLRISSKTANPHTAFKSVRTSEIFADDGELISQSSSAVIYGDAILIGSITDRMVYCDLAGS